MRLEASSGARCTLQNRGQASRTLPSAAGAKSLIGFAAGAPRARPSRIHRTRETSVTSKQGSSRALPPAAVLILALVVPLCSLIPAWHARSETPAGFQFMGFRYMPGDHYQYAAFMQQARDTGSLLMRNPFTSEPQQGVFLLLYFWIVGVT